MYCMCVRVLKWIVQFGKWCFFSNFGAFEVSCTTYHMQDQGMTDLSFFSL